jgi:hypothetical protein
MDHEEVINTIRSAVLKVREDGNESVSVGGLLGYLSELSGEVAKKNGFDEAAFHHDHERNLAHYEAQQQQSLELWRAVITFAQSSLKSALIINGGGAVALLAFIGNIWAKGIAPEAVAPITLSIAYFGFGVLAAALGSATTYVTQYSYAANWQRNAVVFHVATVAIVFISFILFGFGAFEAYTSFAEHLVPNK